MGYPTELFEDKKIKEDFLCAICQDVLQDPLLVEPCEHVFCKQCIDSWRNSSRTCPSCRDPIEEHKPPPRIYMNLLNGLRLQCSFKAQGCPDILELGELESHKKRCAHNPDRKIQCEGACGAVLGLTQVADHSCISYLVNAMKTQMQMSRQMQVEADGRHAETLAAKDKAINELQAVKRELSTTKNELQRCQQQLTALQQPRITHVQKDKDSPTPKPKPTTSRIDIFGIFNKNVDSSTVAQIVEVIRNQIQQDSLPTTPEAMITFKSRLQLTVNAKSPAPGFRFWKAYVGPASSIIIPGTLPNDACMISFKVGSSLEISLWQT